MKTLRIICLLLLSTVIVFSGFAGGTQEGGETGSAESTGTAAEGSMENHLTLTWAPFVDKQHLPGENTEVARLIEERFNVTIKPVDYSIQDEEQVQLRMAEGDMPDFFQDFGYWQTLIDQDLVKPITEDMLREYMPVTVSKLEQLVGKEEFKKQLYIDGQVWGIPHWTAGFEGTQLTAIRKDWLDNVGIDKIPETIDEFGAMLEAFTFDDPDGNGEDDTYGMNQGWFGFFPIYAAYGVHDGWGYSVDENGKVYSPIVQDEYKEALKLLAAWYAEGVIDPEFITDSRNMHVRKFVEGKLGTLVDGEGWFYPTNSNGYIPRLKKANPDAEAVVIKNPKLPGGEHSGMFRAKLIWGRGYAKFFGYNTTEEKIIRILQIQESFAKDWDWYLRSQYGIEGEDYTVENGTVVPNPNLSMDEKVERGIASYSNTVPLVYDEMIKLMPPGNWEIREKSLSMRRVIRGPGFAYTGINEADQQYGSDLGTIVNEFRINAITGKIDIESEWDNYVERWWDFGGREVLEGYQEMYDQMYK
jgi:putative aldouronate transport system substrate-binding protein